MSNPQTEQLQFYFPEPMPIVRDNGDAVVELRQGGELVGEINFSMIVGQWLAVLGIKVDRGRHLRSVP